MFYTYILQSKKMVCGTLEVQMTYGNASSNIMMENQSTQINLNHGMSFIMKHVIISQMQGRENYFLKLVWVNAISRIA